MASTEVILEPFQNHHHQRHPFAIAMTLKPLKVCFSYAAYAKNLIHHLSSSNIPIEHGLSDDEFSSIESTFNLRFPPDLRSILQEGLPVGPGFPNWRSSSTQQLDILTSLPILGFCKEVSRTGFWVDAWGERPNDIDQAVKKAKGLLQKAPFLVPIYRKFYIPSTPCMAGNPVFYVHGGEVRVWSFDIAGFFQRAEFRMRGRDELQLKRPSLAELFAAPAWAAKEARRIEFWTEMAERGVGERKDTRGWWSGELGGCLEEVWWRLREGGWTEEEVREMMMMDGCDDQLDRGDEALDRELVEGKLRVLSARLLRAGWSTEDVVESLGFPEDLLCDGDSNCFEFHQICLDDVKKS